MPSRDADVSSSSEKSHFLCIDDELKACWLSTLASTLLLWAGPARGTGSAPQSSMVVQILEAVTVAPRSAIDAGDGVI